MGWRWHWPPWRLDPGSVERDREEARRERDAARRRLEYARRRAVRVQREADKFAAWVEEALRGQG